MIEFRIGLIRFAGSSLGALILFFFFVAGYHVLLILFGFNLYIFRVIGALLSAGVIISLTEKLGDYGLNKSDVYAASVVECSLGEAIKKGTISPQNNKLVKKVLKSFLTTAKLETDAVNSFDQDLQEVADQQVENQQPEETQQSEEQSNENSNIDLNAWGKEEKVDASSPDGVIHLSKELFANKEKMNPYIENCLWAYAFANEESKGIGKALAEAFVIYKTDQNQFQEKVGTVRTLHGFCNIGFWIFYAMFCLVNTKLSILNIITIVVIGKLIKTVLEESVFKPVLLHLVVREFSQIEWNDNLEQELQSVVSSDSSLKKLYKDAMESEIVDEDETEASSDNSIEVEPIDIDFGDE